ncbi:ABC transporter permease [Alteribacter lacisalsi]|uniref:ABC transporter permease n=1 Tax=Alteribacter lacisalsi TaxID=2045244 RepID=A0A2W0HAZ1_9BACI|nr:ABC transporter permease [Alteribacter lacisalsi]PYZ99024.1 ABC transporter permease [Alteribacter lacisalsi]
MNKNKIIALGFKAVFWFLVLYFLYWAYSNGYFDILFNQTDEFMTLLRQHMTLVALSSTFALLIALPVGIFVTRPAFRKTEWFFMNAANLGQTIPTIAILAIVMSYLGIGYQPAVFALTVFSILPILRNTVAGISSVDSEVLDSAKGMGLTPFQILMKIELPNASMPIIAGIRTAIVMNVGTAALAYLVGGGGLGDFIFTGIMLRSNEYLMSGAVPVTVLAILIDQVLRVVEKVVVPRSLRTT